jgi:hypothetical protein
MEKTESIVRMDALTAKDSPRFECNPRFEVQCKAGKVGALHVGAESLSVQVGQRVLREGTQEIWQSIMVIANEDEAGNLVIRVLVSNPDWEEPLQIASITSRPHDTNCRTALGCDLNHVTA